MFKIEYQWFDDKPIRFGNIMRTLAYALYVQNGGETGIEIKISSGVRYVRSDSKILTEGFHFETQASETTAQQNGWTLLETKNTALELCIFGKRFTLGGSDYVYEIVDDAKFIEFLRLRLDHESNNEYQQKNNDSKAYDLHAEEALQLRDQKFLDYVATKANSSHHSFLAVIGLKEVEKKREQDASSSTTQPNNPNANGKAPQGGGQPKPDATSGLFSTVVAQCKKHYILSTVAVCALGLVACYAAFSGRINLAGLLEKSQRSL